MIITDDNGTTVTVKSACPLCGEPSLVENVSKLALFNWLTGGEYIQNAMPMLSAGERETLLSGSHEKCFDEAFAEDEE